jgi:hypothetical protein
MRQDCHDALIDQLLREILGGDRPRDMTARVLAQARIMDRFRRRNWWLGGVAAAAAITLAVCLTLYWPREYPAPQAEGMLVQDGSHLQRGVELVSSEVDGGMVRLGGYVDISVAPQTSFTIGGTRYRERVVLNRGRLVVHVLQRRGQFDVVVGPATVHVTGTQFTIDVANDNTPTERVKKMIVSVREGAVQVEGVPGGGDVPVSLAAGATREFVISTAPRVLPLLRARAGLLAAAQEGARAGNRGGVVERALEAAANNRAGVNPASRPQVNRSAVRANGPVLPRSPTASIDSASVRLLSTPGSAVRYGKLRLAGDLYFLEMADGSNYFMYQKAALSGTQADWLALPLDESTRVAWEEGQVISVIQGGSTPSR